MEKYIQMAEGVTRILEFLNRGQKTLDVRVRVSEVNSARDFAVNKGALIRWLVHWIQGNSFASDLAP